MRAKSLLKIAAQVNSNFLFPVVAIFINIYFCRTNDLSEVNEFRFDSGSGSGSGCPNSDPRFRKEHFVFGESESLEYVGTILRGSLEFETILSSMEKVNLSSFKGTVNIISSDKVAACPIHNFLL